MISVIEINKLYHPWIGGVETVVKTIAEALKKEMNIQVICCNTQLKTTTETINNVTITKYGSFGTFFSLPISLPFILNFKKHTADILHFHLPNPLAVIAYFIHRPKGKVIITWHSDIIKQKFILFFYAPFLKWFLKKADKIIVTSPNMAQNSIFLKKHKQKTVIIPLGICTQKYQIQTKKTLKPDRYVLFVGRFIYYKGVLELIQALKQCSVTTILIGDGPLLNQMQEDGAHLIKNKQLYIFPFQSESALISYFQHCDFFVLPSTHPSEAFGIVQLEAMICKKPVISTNLPTGVPYVNKHNESGIIVPPKDTNKLAKAIQTLWDNHEQRNQLGTNAYHRCINYFTEDQMIEKTCQLINELHKTNIK
jgi:glycosyltransferase involved in cell wall biosynthesis